MFFQGDDQLQRVHRIEAEPVRAEDGGLVADLFRGVVEHQFLDHHLLDFLPQFVALHDVMC